MSEQQQAEQPASSRDTVNIACRVSNGLVLRVSDWVDDPQNKGEKLLKEIDLIELAGLRGRGVEQGLPGFGAGYAVTRDVPAALWSAWLAQNGTSDLVVNGLVFETDEAEPEPESEPEPTETSAASPARTSKKKS